MSAHQGFYEEYSCPGTLDYTSKVPVSRVIFKVLKTLGSLSEQITYLEKVGFELDFGG